MSDNHIRQPCHTTISGNHIRNHDRNHNRNHNLNHILNHIRQPYQTTISDNSVRQSYQTTIPHSHTSNHTKGHATDHNSDHISNHDTLPCLWPYQRAHQVSYRDHISHYHLQHTRKTATPKRARHRHTKRHSDHSRTRAPPPPTLHTALHAAPTARPDLSPYPNLLTLTC